MHPKEKLGGSAVANGCGRVVAEEVSSFKGLLEQMVYAIIALGETTHMVMEIIGLYREPVVATLHEYGIHVTVPIH